MDAVKFFKEKKRMCDTFGNCCNYPMSESNTHDELDCTDFEEAYPEKAVAVIEKWSKEHPVITKERREMDDLIKRQDVMELMDWYDHNYGEIESYLNIIREDIKSLPSAEPTWKKCLICGAKIEVDEDGNVV